MSLSALQQAIVNEARMQAEAIAADAASRIKEEQTRGVTEVRALEESIITNAKAAAAQTAQRLLQEADLAGRAAILRVKQKALDTTQEELAQRLRTLSPQEAEHLFGMLIQQLPDTAGTITLGEHTAKVLRSRIKQHHTVSPEHIPQEAGFIFSSDRIEVKCTAAALAERLFLHHRTEIAHHLFT